MTKVEIEYANIIASWTFDQIISQLPTPGTEPFSFLIKELKLFDLTARQISFDAPGSSLADVSLTLNLLNSQLTARLTYSSIELTVQDVVDEDVPKILKIISILLAALKKLDSNITQGIGTARIGLHAVLREGSVEDFFKERLLIKLTGEKVKPEALVFALETDETTELFTTKVTVANSAAYPNALFIEIQYQANLTHTQIYTENPIVFFENASNNYESVFKILDLELVEG